MLPKKKHSYIRPIETIYQFDPDTTRVKVDKITPPYDWQKVLKLCGSLCSTLILALMIWGLSLPTGLSLKKETTLITKPVPPRSDQPGSVPFEGKQPAPKRLHKSLGHKHPQTRPVVQVTGSKPTQAQPAKKTAIETYNQAVMNDRQGDYNVAIQQYQAALRSQDPAIQQNATAILKRLNYLIRHKGTL